MTPVLGVSYPIKLVLKNGLVIRGPLGTIVELNGKAPHSRGVHQHTFRVHSSKHGPSMEFFADQVVSVERQPLPNPGVT